MKYRIKINTPNRIFIIKGKPVRTPVEWIIDSSELEQVKVKIKLEAVQDYSIEEFKPKKKKKIIPKKLTIKTSKKKVKVTNDTTLGKLSED